MPDLDAFGMILEGGSGGGSGGGGTSMVEIVDSTTTSKTFTEISGGTVYRFLQPLGTLDVQAMPTDTREAVIIFDGGTTVNRTPVVSVVIPLEYEDDEGNISQISSYLPLSANNSGWAYVADGRVWCEVEAETDVETHATMTIISGGLSCISSGGGFVVSAENLTFVTTKKEGDAPETTTSSAVHGVVAQSTDGTTWTINSAVTFPYIYGYIGDVSIYSGSSAAMSVTSASETTGPMQVSLPASAGIVQMPEFTSGGKYVVSLQYGLAVGAEYEVQS